MSRCRTRNPIYADLVPDGPSDFVRISDASGETPDLKRLSQRPWPRPRGWRYARDLELAARPRPGYLHAG